MSVDFDEDPINIRRSFEQKEVQTDKVKPSLIIWLQKIGIFKDEKKALIFLVAIVVLCLIASIIIFYRGVISPQTPHSNIIRKTWIVESDTGEEQ